MLIAAHLVITPNWKQPKYPSGDNDRLYIHTTKYYIVVMDEQQPDTTTWMNLSNKRNRRKARHKRIHSGKAQERTKQKKGQKEKRKNKKQANDYHGSQETGYLREEGGNCDHRESCRGLLGCCQCSGFGLGGGYPAVF